MAPNAEVSDEVVQRVSLCVPIHAALRDLLPPIERQRRWPRAPNRGRPFAGRAALDVMSGDLDALRAVRVHLEAVCN